MKTTLSQNATHELDNVPVKAWKLPGKHYMLGDRLTLQMLVSKWEFKMTSHIWVTGTSNKQAWKELTLCRAANSHTLNFRQFIRQMHVQTVHFASLLPA